MDQKPWLKHYDPGVPAHIDYPDITLVELFSRTAQKFPQQACTVFHDHILTYQQVDRLTDWLASGLIAMGVQKGEPVGVLLPNIPQFVLAFYAILKAGAIVTAMNPQYKARELQYQINDSGVKVLIGLSSHKDLLSEVRSGSSLEKAIFTSVEDAALLSNGIESNRVDFQALNFEETDTTFNHLLAFGREHSQVRPAIGSDDPAIFQYSGGTTGVPKAAVGLHRNLVANTLQFRYWLAGMQDGREVVLAAIPLYHVYGMVIAMNVGVALGASLLLVQNPRNIQDILEQIQRYRATLFPGVPSLYQAINNHPDVAAGKINLGSIKACISGSAPLPAETKEKFEALTGGKLMEGYGLSEAPTATHCNPMFGENRSGSIGLPLPDVNCRIVDLEDAQRDLPLGEAGELLISGPQVMKGYHRRPDDERETLVDGWLRTGDIARMDNEGYFYLVDRKKELIKIGGLQVWPREVEEVIGMHPKVKEAAVSGVPDAVKGELVKAWVVTQQGESISEDEIRSWCKQYLAYYKVPTLVRFREDLPRSGVGKVLRRELKRLHIEGMD